VKQDVTVLPFGLAQGKLRMAGARSKGSGDRNLAYHLHSD